MKRTSVQFRRTILATACVLAAGAASAQVSSSSGPTGIYNLSFGAGVSPELSLRDYILAITAPQENPESVSALIQAASAGGTYQSGAAHGVTVGGNSIAAKATGSDNSSSADLALLRSGAEGQDGIGIATSQLRGGSYSGALTEARIDDSHVGIQSYGMTPATAAIEGNTLSASAVLNQSASTASGVVPAGYGASQPVAQLTAYSMEPSLGAAAQVSTSVDGMSASTAGSVNVATYQSAQQAGLDAGSGASVRNSDVSLQLSGGGTAEQALNLKDNGIAASYVANSASGAVQATGGSAFAASAMVTNAQVNGEGRYLPPEVPVDGPLVPVPVDPLSFAAFSVEAPNATALVEGSRITADLGAYEESAPTQLDAALRLTGNSISASSTGNAAGARLADGTVQAGNSIVLDASTVGRNGYGYGYGAGAMLHADGSYSDAQLYADLGVLNTQANRSTTLASRVTDSGVAVRVDRLQSQAAVALSGNTMNADATGNLAGNLVDIRATDFGATVAAGNVQSNDDTSISATHEGSQITVEGGGSGRKATVGGSTTLSDNTIAATAAGNLAATSVSVQATSVQSVDAESGSAQAMAQAWDGTYASARGGITASNLQSNTGSKQSIDASIYGGVVGADLTGGYDSVGRPRLDGASVALTGNTLSAQATGNSAATGASVSGTDGLAHAAVANAQTNDVRVSAMAMETGVVARTGPAAGSTIAVQGNTVSAAATANQANNTLSAQFANMDVSSSPYYYGDSIDGPGFYGNPAVQAISSAQRTTADVGASNTSESGFATATVTGARGTTGSNITVQGNQATAAATGNQVRNAIAIDAGSMSRQYGAGASIADLSNVQDNVASTHSLVSGYGQDLSIGAHVQGALDSSNIAVTGNAARATATANDASNKLAVTGGSLDQSRGFAAFDMVPSYGGTDFNLANSQTAYGAEVQAQASDVRIAIERAGERNDYAGGSTLAVNGNTIAAEARVNNAVNAASLTGFTTLASSAAVSNNQYGETNVGATVDGAQLRIRSVDSSVESSQLAMKDNTVKSLAVGASATNSLDVQATTLQGVAPVYAPLSPLAVAPMGMDSAPSGYAVNNNQSQLGSVAARTEGSVRMNLSDSGLQGGSATVSGNAISAVAQATSAGNTLNLAGTTVGTGGSVSNTQWTSGSVSAEQAFQPQAGGSFVVQAGGTYAAPVTVSNNSVLASAGQNEAFNSASASGATVAGQFSVLNAQQGQGSVSAHAEPGLVGTSAGAAYGSSLAVTGNTVAAKAAFNTATNNLAVEATAANAAGGSLNNVQTTNGGNGTASVGSYEGRGTIVGVSQGLNGYGQGVALNGGTATVNGNGITADATGNSAANTLSVAAPAATGYSYGPAWSVLNTQANAAALNATVTYGGLFLSGASLQGSSAAVTGNTLAATASGNTASNSLSLAGTQAGYGQGATISNVQTNSASISAMVRGAMVGAGAGMVGGGSTAVSGNAISAQAVGNTAVNKLVAK